MTEADKKLLFEDLCGRLPYGVKAKVLGWDEENEEEVYVDLRVYSINTDGYVYFESNDYDVDYVQFDDCQLYLRSMSSMTEEEKKHCFVLEHDGNIGHPNGIFYRSQDYLNSIHVDYRGLIEKGLALEAPEGMYKI